MTITIISDTHNKHQFINKSEIPITDVLIHCGDITNKGTLEEAESFLEWFSNLPHKYKIFIAGNHDFLFENKVDYNFKEIIPENIIYLENNGITIDGINFWGSPDQPTFFKMAFNKTKLQRKESFAKIPKNTDVLITHCPPHRILDETKESDYVGCEVLWESVKKIEPKLHVFGHIHEAYGIKETEKTTFVNASLLNEYYKRTNAPIVITL